MATAFSVTEPVEVTCRTTVTSTHTYDVPEIAVALKWRIMNALSIVLVLNLRPGQCAFN